MVSALGYGTTGLSVGQRVFGLTDWTRDGTLAEYVAVEARNLAPLPGDVDFTVGASLPISGLTAWQGLFVHGRVQVGQSVLVHGAAGGVGSMVTQLAREVGAYVIGTGRAADRQTALDFGAQEFVDLQNDSLEDVGGVDLVFDVIGGESGRVLLWGLRPWPRLPPREVLAPLLVALLPQPKQREQWKPEEQQHRLRRVRLGQRRQARQWVTSQPLLCRRVKGLRLLNRRRHLLPLLRPQAPALKLLQPRRRRKATLRPRTLRDGPAILRFHTTGADMDHPHNCESTGRNKQWQKQRKLNRLTSAPAKSGMSGSGIKSRARTIGVSRPSFRWQRRSSV